MPAMSALTAFTDTTVPHQASLNNLSTNIDTLCQISAGYTAAWGAVGKPFTKAILTSDQSVATSSLNAIVWSQVLVDVGNMFLDANPENLATITLAGWYRIEAQAAFFSAPQSERRVSILINGILDAAITEQVSTQMSTEGGLSNNQRLQVVGIQHLTAGTQVSVAVWQTSGTAVNILSNKQWGCWATISYEAPY